MIWHRLKRWLYLTHRWVGIASCLLFVLWFVSGLVMLYVPFPSLSPEERLDGLSEIDWAQVQAGPGAAAETGGFGSPVREAVLEMRGERPVWRVSPWSAQPQAVWAADAAATGMAGETEARSIAETFGKAPVAGLRSIYNDQWTVSGSYDAHRPLWKAELAGEGGRVLYVSSSTGEVVLDTDKEERFWNWLGSVPHWLYPRALREDQPLWRQVVLWVSGPCILGAVTGLWIGLMRLRMGRHRFKGGRISPYRGWMKWHHLSGMIGSIFLILWIFSGWLSVDPGRLFASEGLGSEARLAYAGTRPLPEIDPAELSRAASGAHRVVLGSAAGRSYLRIQRPGEEDRLLDAGTLEPLAPGEAHIRSAAALLLPGTPIVAIDRLTAPDAYWYAVKGELPLPVLRFRFGDPAETWVHIDPATGDILGGSDTRRRTYRWLFDLFHRWDWGPLLRHPPARDLLIWLMSIAGLISSVTAVYVGWRRLRRPRAR